MRKSGIAEVVLTGDTRFDRVYEQTLTPTSFPIIDEFAPPGTGVLVVGSAWSKDISSVLDFIESYAGKALGNFSKIKIIIAPHVVSGVVIKMLKRYIKASVIAYSEWENKPAVLPNVLIIDNVGMLAALYAKADVAWVGGAFKEGLHNVLEPAAFGKPIITGPQHKGYPEARELTQLGGLFAVETAESATQLLVKLFENDAFRSTAGTASAEFVMKEAGAARRVINYLQNKKYLK